MDPVFLDRTGRRRRLFVAVGSVGGLLLAVAALALVAGFTGAGPGSVPGWPGGADDRRVDRPESVVSVRPQVTRQTVTGGVDRTTAPAAPGPTATSAPAAATSSTPSASVNPHRRVPTHTPNPRKSKEK
ncbi:hypothetical protein [Actinoplanes sp. NPDC049599]|uniref:hypothetical protein n=1 Tax=Actinoplanes sp. NPDC049599 TaxID=3363903 RepID=UPI0037B39F84